MLDAHWWVEISKPEPEKHINAPHTKTQMSGDGIVMNENSQPVASVAEHSQKDSGYWRAFALDAGSGSTPRDPRNLPGERFPAS